MKFNGANSCITYTFTATNCPAVKFLVTYFPAAARRVARRVALNMICYAMLSILRLPCISYTWSMLRSTLSL